MVQTIDAEADRSGREDAPAPGKKLRLLDLFSGIGGFSLGLERSGGFETVAFCEIEPFCRREKSRAEQLAGLVQPCTWPTVSSARDRGTGHGVPDGTHRNKSIGNAVVPQIPELIGRAITAALLSDGAPTRHAETPASAPTPLPALDTKP